MSSSLAIARASSKVSTIGQARAALGVVATVCREAYTKIDGIAAVTVGDVALGFAAIKAWSGSDLRSDTRARVDVVNNYAQRVYAIWNSDADLQDQEISAVNAMKVALACAQANDALADVEKLVGMKLWDLGQLLEDAIAAAGGIAGAAVQSATNAIAAAGAAFIYGTWPALLAGAVVVYIFRAPIIKALKGAV